MLRLCVFNSLVESVSNIPDDFFFVDPIPYVVLGKVKKMIHSTYLDKKYGTRRIPDFVRKDRLFHALCFKIESNLKKTYSCFPFSKFFTN